MIRTVAADESDASLLARARLGDQDAFTALVRWHFPRLRAVAWRIVRNWADAEDVAQEALSKACQHLSSYQERAAFSTWLTRIAVNEAVGLLRKRRTRPIDLAEGDTTLPEAPLQALRDGTPEQAVASSEIVRTVRRCVDRTRPAYRVVLRFSILDELNHGEIAERLGLTVSTVKLRLHRGRRALQKMLHRQGVAFSRQRVSGRARNTLPPAPGQQVSGNCL
jgi:RNA polymerase sigma-70 factor (ECF subfamily)